MELKNSANDAYDLLYPKYKHFEAINDYVYCNFNLIFETLYYFNNTETFINTGNYVLNKYLIDNLNLDEEMHHIHFSSACDVIYFNTLLFEQLNLNMHVVPNLTYSHVVHDGSIYTKTCNEFRQFNEYVYQRYKKLL